MRFLSALFLISISFYGNGSAQLSEPKSETAKVTSVIDGDTIIVVIDGRYEKVRLLGINAPEMSDTRPKVKCFARNAKKKTEETLIGLTVTLVADKSQANRDRYGRLLRYLYRNKDLFNEWIIRKG